MSNALSPIFSLFLAPFGKLYLKVQQLLAHGETHDATPHPIVGKRRPGPKHSNYGIPASAWPTVVQHVVEQKKPLRTVAAAYGVSHETITLCLLLKKLSLLPISRNEVSYGPLSRPTYPERPL